MRTDVFSLYLGSKAQTPKLLKDMVGTSGFEPLTSTVSIAYCL